MNDRADKSEPVQQTATPCPHSDGCELFPHFSKGGLLRVWQLNYCESEFGRCERYKKSARGEQVSPQMLPNGRMLSHWKAAT